MKNINYMNYAMVGIPCTLGLLGFIEPGCWIFGALFTILTGAFQFVTGTGMLIDCDGKDIHLRIYFGGVVIFFSLWIFTDWFWIIAIPPLLALYLSIIIYKKAKHTKP